jgi:hypothetical protein
MTTTAPTSRRLIHFLAGPALALGLTLGSAAVANAVWDIGAYDDCMRKIPTIMSHDEFEDAHYDCCVKSGGIYKLTHEKCVAPGVDSQGRVPTHVMQPSPLPSPPGDIGPATGGVG